MKNLLLLFVLLLSISFTSCTNDDAEQLTVDNIIDEPFVPKTFVLESTGEVLDYVTVEIRKGNVLVEQVTVNNVMNFTIVINEGNSLSLFVGREGAYAYNYRMYNNDDNVELFNRIIPYAFNHTTAIEYFN